MPKDTQQRYIQGLGRRKTSVASVRITPAEKREFSINGGELHAYFPTRELEEIVRGAFSTAGVEQKFSVSVNVRGGGIHAQAEAVRHGISRALVKYDAELRRDLKKAGFLKRDPRMKERKKFGLRKARRAPQWSKR